MSWREHLVMGAHGMYVWSAYGFAVVVLIGNGVRAYFNQSQQLKRLKEDLENQ